jgi:hypothetical protein
MARKSAIAGVPTHFVNVWLLGVKPDVARTVLEGLRGPMLHSGELIFAVAIVNVPTPWLRLFVRLRLRVAR